MFQHTLVDEVRDTKSLFPREAMRVNEVFWKCRETPEGEEGGIRRSFTFNLIKQSRAHMCSLTGKKMKLKNFNQ